MVVVDCLEEIDRLAAAAAAAGRVQDVYVRIAPGVAAETHDYMATGGDDVKFGFPVRGGHAEQAVLAVAARPRCGSPESIPTSARRSPRPRG